jgi:hypothetical protein
LRRALSGYPHLCLHLSLIGPYYRVDRIGRLYTNNSSHKVVVIGGLGYSKLCCPGPR